jgi:hypothetical protein
MSAWYIMVRVLQLMQRNNIWILPFLQDQSVKNDTIIANLQ